MGYYMQQMDAQFVIEKKHFDKVRERLVAFSKEGHAWVPDISEEDSIEDAFTACRWDVTVGETGDIKRIEFVGEKLGDDEQLFRSIAEFVQPGSYVQLMGEDSSMWRWTFGDDGRFDELSAKITWE